MTTNNCGCAGTWTLTYTGSGSTQQYTGTYEGYEADNPYLNDDGHYFNNRPVTSLKSACDGRYFDQYFAFLDGAHQPTIVSSSFQKTDPNCGVGPLYDCINGECLASTQYGTPGIYSSLEECQGNCGGCQSPNVCIDPSNYCPPGKICIPLPTWQQIEAKTDQIQNKFCK